MNCKILSAFLRNPKAVGTLFSGSNAFAQILVSFVSKDMRILEIGAGGGVITKALLNAGHDSQNIFICEQDLDFY